MNQIKICECCGYSFRPQLTDSQWRDFYFTEEQQERAELFASEHPTNMGGVRYDHPTQVLCDLCSAEKDIVVKDNWYGSRFKKKRTIRLTAPKDE